uniref:Eukaryotic translation initiation factor 2 subunit gamma-like n=1 Tax=Tanacetum cinerariifolium TaxID=118510 RepID=A0A699I470_TANCI|nr:eukaryotic translation initiation factor 2 subunit gamma-like [Tanacetum cinerariifolium]
MDPTLTKSDRLVGHMLGEVGSLPDVYDELKVGMWCSYTRLNTLMNVKLSKNKTSVTTCNNSLNAKTLNVKSISAMCAKSVMIDKHDLCVPKSIDKPLKKTVGSESNKKPRNNVRKLHECFGKIYKWSYIKFTPSGYIWKPKSGTKNVNSNVSMPLGISSRTTHVKDTMTSMRSIVSNTPLSSNSFAAHRMFYSSSNLGAQST